MSSLLLFSSGRAAGYAMPAGVGSRLVFPGVAVGKLRLPTDPIGNAIVTFKGVQAGSEIRVYLPDQSEAAGIESCVADQVLSWPTYAAGNPNNSVRVVIVHLDLKIKEFIYEASVGAQNLPVQQEPDKWHSNP